MKADKRIRAIQIYRFYLAGCATGLPEDCVAGQDIIATLEKLLAWCERTDFCERCASPTKEGVCAAPGCEHNRVLSDIDATE